MQITTNVWPQFFCFLFFFIILEMSAYKCWSCNGSFSEVEAALNHVNTHEKFQKGCVHPKCKYKKQTRLSRHTRKQHPASCNYDCIPCKSVFVRAADLSNHVRLGHCRIHEVKKVHCKARLASASTMPSTSFNQLPSTSNLRHFTQRTSTGSLLAAFSARSNQGNSKYVCRMRDFSGVERA